MPELWVPAHWGTILAGLLVVATFVGWEYRSWYRLRHIPGPPLASFSVLWQLKHAVGGRYHDHLRDVAEKYGPLARIGPNELICTDPEVLRKMSAVRSSYTKGLFYESGRVVPGVDNVVSLRDEVAHKAMRAKMGPAYAARENEGFSFESGIDRQIANFVNLIDSKYISADGGAFMPLDFAEKTQYLALDAISDISFGSAFGFLAEDRDLYQYIEINDSALPVMNVVSVLPWLARLVHQWPLRLALPKEGDKVGFGRLMGVATNIVEKRMEPGAKPQKDMMQAHINNGVTRDELVQLVFIHIIAGSNTVAQAMRMTLLCLLNNPAAYRTLQREIDEAAASGTISSPISNAEALKLPYLQAVIREGLRVYPPVTGLGFKQVPEGGDHINGYFVPGGTQIGQNFYGVGRSKAIWGDDADVFRPERWLGAGEEAVRRMSAAVDLHFGYGKYSCLGKPIAMMELNKVFVELLRRYDFTVINHETPIKTLSSVFWIASDFWLKVTKR